MDNSFLVFFYSRCIHVQRRGIEIGQWSVLADSKCLWWLKSIAPLFYRIRLATSAVQHRPRVAVSMLDRAVAVIRGMAWQMLKRPIIKRLSTCGRVILSELCPSVFLSGRALTQKRKITGRPKFDVQDFHDMNSWRCHFEVEWRRQMSRSRSLNKFRPTMRQK